MVEADALFKVFDIGGNKVFGTQSTDRNIHSHYLGGDSLNWSSYRFSGRLRMTDSNSGIGVTFYSQYTNEDVYYRLRRYSSGAFHLSPHNTSLSGDLDSGVVPAANTWYRFIIEVQNVSGTTEIRAKVWQDGSAEPGSWQIAASDSSATRIETGRIGLWSYTSGSKYWDDLLVEPLPTAETAGQNLHVVNY